MRRLSEKPANSRYGQFHQPYIIVNLILAGIISGAIGYSALYSPEGDNYPVQCTHQLLTGKLCPTCGLSHSFSAMVRGHFDEAEQFSSFGPRIFIFFAGQLLLRFLFSLALIMTPAHRKKLIWIDAVTAILIFAWAFTPLIQYMLHLVKS